MSRATSKTATSLAAVVSLALLQTAVSVGHAHHASAGKSQQAAAGNAHHVTAKLVPVGGSGISGVVQLEQLPGGGTQTSIVAKGLKPGVQYLSLYYENHTCEVEPYEEDDVIGRYTADPAGVGRTAAKKGDDLDEINSVSVRRASDFALMACADVHPGS